VCVQSTVRHDRFTKRRLYQEQRIPTVWLVNTEAACVEVWTPDDTLPTVVRNTLTWQAPGVSAVLRLEVAALLGVG
jgi:hypothetical protein